MSTTIDGACPKMYTASQLSLDDIVDWNNVTFSNVDGNLSYNVDVEDKTVQVKFSNMDELFGSLAYSYSETIEGTTRSGSGSFLLTNNSYENPTSTQFILVDNLTDISDQSECTLRDAIKVGRPWNILRRV